MEYLYEIDSFVFPEKGKTRIRATKVEGKFTDKSFVCKGRRISLDDIDKIDTVLIPNGLSVAYTVWSREEDVQKNTKALIEQTMKWAMEIVETAKKLEKAVETENFEFYDTDKIFERSAV